ncbi:MAG TPA: asparagine synthase (glutamine-hydrolyzing) [Thermoanaerobaculia bacterium]|nr:asparagine synthase (glutamine-hydrolyzing) [Thermoanaerobaculia bacterium]
MCGIAGWIGNQRDGELWSAQLATCLRHRGPDAGGVRAWPGFTLVHARLSIIDLSPRGAQPMPSANERVWLVFNGEIYNHHELRADLEAKGYRFRGNSDSEVIPALYQEYGKDFVTRLRGMFALALVDLDRNRMLLVRDRFGIKPMFYAATEDRIAFASEIRALRRLPGVDDTMDAQALSDYVSLLFVPAPQTFFKGIRSLEPGCLLDAQLGADGRVSMTIERWHQWSIDVDDSLDLETATARAEQLVARAVEQQLESDVPLGSLLSGGIDSSLVAWAAQRRLGATPLHTFNVRFSDPVYDETWAALAVARHIHSAHETLDMPEGEGTWERVTGLLRHAGQPFADTSMFAVNSVSALMRKHVTVALSGDGGDEAFGGYGFYQQIEQIARWQRLPGFVRGGITAAATPLAKLGVVNRRLPQRMRGLSQTGAAAIAEQLMSWIRPDEHAALLRGNGVLPVRRHFEAQWKHSLPPHASLLESLSAHMTEVNTRLILPNDYLFKVDIASMHASLEVRVPMLDEELFAFGLTLPHRLKVHRGEKKAILRRVAEKALPLDVARKPKRGFEVPVDRWTTPDFRSRAREELLSPQSPLATLFEPAATRRIVEAFAAGTALPDVSRPGLYQRAIMFLSLHEVLRDRD